MNERIFTLLQDQNGRSGLNWTEEDKTEFAELIIQKCLRLCDEVDLAGADDCIQNIKDYFEVEE